MNAVVAIDGPSASGKSTVARMVAEALDGFVYVDSGAMYRAVTWRALQAGLDPANADAVAAWARGWDGHLEIVHGAAVYWCGNEVVDRHALRSPETNAAVSLIAAIPDIRAKLVAEQRRLRQDARLVMEGRDIGTAVFPDTPFKFYLDAHPEVREARRAKQGETDRIVKRDAIDASRRASPLMAAPDAVVIDSSHQSIVEVVDHIVAAVVGGGIERRRGPVQHAAPPIF